MRHQLLQWETTEAENGVPIHHELMLQVTKRSKPVSVAIVFENGAWFTWARDGARGEKSMESTVYRAKIEAAASAIDQGFI